MLTHYKSITIMQAAVTAAACILTLSMSPYSIYKRNRRHSNPGFYIEAQHLFYG